MSSESDYYGVLHVRPDAPTEVIRASYRTLMQTLKAHPDLGGPQDQAALINQAYRVLSDPARRAEYDRRRSAGHAAGLTNAGTGMVCCLFCAHELPLEALDKPDAECGRCRSPLTPATRHRLERSTRRMLRRMEREMPVRISTDWRSESPIDGMMRNLSLNGMLFEADRAFETNQLIRIDCDPCRALARVTHTRPAADGRFATGVEFVTLHFSSVRGTFVTENV